MYNSLVIKDTDSVATVIAPVKAGEDIIYNIGGEEKKDQGRHRHTDLSQSRPQRHQKGRGNHKIRL